VGCYVGKFFVGALAYADDIVLLAPTPSVMWKLLQICEQYAQEYSTTFNAKKSRCMVAAPRNHHHLHLSGNICHFVIDSNSNIFVDSFLHLGHIISSVSGDNEDISHRRCKLLDKPIVYYDFWNLNNSVTPKTSY